MDNFVLPTNLEERLITLARDASSAILDIYNTDFDVETKTDSSPLTLADMAAHKIIVKGLRELTPNIPIISEESVLPEFSERSKWQTYWLVDPLDGTKEFVNRNGEFTVNIALMKGNAPHVGVVCVPVQERTYVGNTSTMEARVYSAAGERPAKSRRFSEKPNEIKVVASRSHVSDELRAYLASLEETFSGVETISMGSSLKLCALADAEADLYPRLGPTSEWDIAAAHAVLVAAGGQIYVKDGSPLTYNLKENILNPDFIAVGDASFPWAANLPVFPGA